MRLVVVLLLAVPVFLVSAFMFAASRQDSTRDLLPDLVTMAPREVTVRWEEGRKLLRFTNDIANLDTGLLELFPGVGREFDCGDLGEDARLVFQRIYQDMDASGYYSREIDSDYRDHLAGCMVFHPEHDHWHFDDFTEFELLSEDGSRVEGVKTSTCMMDSELAEELPGSPRRPHYEYEDCGQDTPQGISVGWLDRYAWDLPDMYIDVTDVPDGDYCLVSTADPENRIRETNDTNNAAVLAVTLDGDEVRERDEGCEGVAEARGTASIPAFSTPLGT